MSERTRPPVIPPDIRDYGKPPRPTLDKPHVQVQWIFQRVISLKATPATRGHYEFALKFYLEHLKAEKMTEPYLLKKEWDQYALMSFREQVERRGANDDFKYASLTLMGLFSCVRVVMRHAASEGHLACEAVADVTYGSGAAETDVYAAYSDGEMAQVIDVLGSALQDVRACVKPYVAQSEGVGRDPRINKERGNANGYGFGVEANMRWYFEHVLDCRPITFANPAEHKTFLHVASNHHGGLHTMYRRWGVTVDFDVDMLMPLVMQLAYLTGLNPGPLLALDVDCYGASHPATNAPYLRFVKSKTSSQHELHLNLLDSDDKDEDEEVPLVNNKYLFSQEVRYLPRKQAHQVAKTIGMILSATALLREELPADSPHKRRLLIYRATSNFSDGQVCGLSPATSSQWCRLVVQKYNLVGDDGSPLKLNLVRFRSSKLTELARQGRDLLEIRLIASHKSVRTTMGYLSRRKLDVTENRVLRNALEQIRANREEFGTSSCARPPDERPIQIFRGIVSDCKNVYDPPKKVRLARSYQPGKACSRFNMCLFCKNIIIFREHLPLLISYLGQINVSLENNVQNVPTPRLYEDSKAIIEALIDPETGEFSEKDIRWARDASANESPLVDPLIFRAVE